MPSGNPGKPRPERSAYRPEYCEQATKLCRLGARNVDLADFFGVDEATIKKTWPRAHPEFREAMALGKMHADAEVANSLYRRAVGYEHRVEKITRAGIVQYTERFPPETLACIFWLKNRRPDLWRDVQEKRVSGDFTVRAAEAKAEAELEKLAPDVLAELRSVLAEAIRGADESAAGNGAEGGAARH